MLGPNMALVLRAKSGSNFLIQTHGIPGKLAQDAVSEVLLALSRYSKDGARAGLKNGSGDAPPNFALGQMSALHGRYLVTYRMVNSILVLLVSEPGANAFLCLRTLDAATKILVGACKGVDVTPEKLSKRYGDVHALLGDLISGGIAALPPAFIHTSATDERLLAVPLSAADASRRLKKLLAGGKTSTFVPDKPADGAAESTPPPVPETPRGEEGKVLNALEPGGPLAALEFAIPSDALPPPPARALGAKRRPPAPPPVVVPVRPAAFKGAVDEDAENKPPTEAEGFGAFEEVKLMEAEKAEADEGEWAADFKEGAEAAAGAPVASIDDLKEALLLVEVWRGEVAGGVLTKAGTTGEVRRRLAPYGISSALFRLLPSPALVVNACLQTAAVNKAHSAPVGGARGFDLAATLSGAPMDTAYLRYGLPSVACDPPLQLDLAVAPQADRTVPGQPAQTKWRGLVVLRYAVNPALSGTLLDVVADVDLGPEFAEVLQVSPAAQWSPNECRLRWKLGRLEPGSSGCVRAVMAAKAGTPATRAIEALQASTVGKVVFTGWPGQALSGVGFEVAMADGDGAAADYHTGKVVTFGEVTLRP